MTNKSERDPGDDGVAAEHVTRDATERHLVKARALLREARSRLDARGDEATDSSVNERSSVDSEEPHG